MKTVQNACEMSGAGAKTRVWRKHTRMSCRPCEQKRPKKKIQSIRVSHIPRKKAQTKKWEDPSFRKSFDRRGWHQDEEIPEENRY